jgi:hypothetical protein
MNWIKRLLNKPLHYPRLLDINFFKNKKVFRTNIPLYNDYEKAYEEYLLKYKSYERDEKLKSLGI